jgi:hypothetical protein
LFPFLFPFIGLKAFFKHFKGLICLVAQLCVFVFKLKICPVSYCQVKEFSSQQARTDTGPGVPSIGIIQAMQPFLFKDWKILDLKSLNKNEFAIIWGLGSFHRANVTRYHSRPGLIPAPVFHP